MTATYKIAEVARRSGFNATTLRYYEGLGLVTPSERTDAGYRLYDDGSLARLAFIARAKQLGCSLDEITGLVQAWDGGQCAPVQTRLRELVATKISDAQSRIAELVALTAQLQDAAATLGRHTPAGPCDDTCGCTTAPSDDGPTVTAVTLTAKLVAPADPPIACTLGADHIPQRMADWQDVLDRVVSREPIEGGYRLGLAADASLATVAELAAAEQACCSFFRFALTLDARGAALEVTADETAADLVQALFGAPS